MESLLEDMPAKKSPEGFLPFIEKPAEIQEPEEEEALPPTIVEAPDTPAAEESELDQSMEGTPQEEDTVEETPGTIPVESPADASAKDHVQEEKISEEDQTSEVVFEQVEGPKVEVVSVKDEVQKIIVHLAPDKILEIDCEY